MPKPFMHYSLADYHSTVRRSRAAKKGWRTRRKRLREAKKREFTPEELQRIRERLWAFAAK